MLQELQHYFSEMAFTAGQLVQRTPQQLLLLLLQRKTSSVQIDASAYRSAEYLIQGTQGTKVRRQNFLPYMMFLCLTGGTVHNGETLATFDVQIVGGQLTLLVTSASTTSTYLQHQLHYDQSLINT